MNVAVIARPPVILTFYVCIMKEATYSISTPWEFLQRPQPVSLLQILPECSRTKEYTDSLTNTVLSLAGCCHTLWLPSSDELSCEMRTADRCGCQNTRFIFMVPCVGKTGGLDQRGMFRMGRLWKTQALFQVSVLI